MKNITKSLIMITAVAAIVIGATYSYFSDTETSTGNTFTAGAIDLKIDNTSYATDYTIPGFQNPTGALAASPTNTWQLADLTNQLFFNFQDLKPGDVGEDTISMHVNNNDAWACMNVKLTGTPENDANEAEVSAGDSASDTTGELQNELNFAFWTDDGDNVYETGENLFIQPTSAATLFDGDNIPIMDSQTQVFGGPTFMIGDRDYFIGKIWCYGTLTAAPVTQDGGHASNPLHLGTGFTCNGEPVTNVSQTDGIVADVNFSAVQARNNVNFLCSSLNAPEAPVVGAALGEYTQPTGVACNVNVPGDFSTIQAAIDDVNTTSGETICVGAGTYTGDVNVNKDITLSGDGASATSTINGVSTAYTGAVVISANGATVEGFNIIGAGQAAIYISGARDNVTVRYNKAVAATGKNALLMDGGQSNHSINNNVFEGAASQLVYVNGHADVSVASTNVDFTNNTFGGTATGPLLGISASGSSITLNKFSGTTGYTSIESWEGNNLVNQNNFNVDAVSGPIHVTNGNNLAVGYETQFPITLNAENNWWGDTDPSDNTTGLVDSSPSEASAFPEN